MDDIESLNRGIDNYIKIIKYMLIGLSIAEFLEAIIFGKIVCMTLMIGLPIVWILLQIPDLKLRKLLKQY